MCQQYDLKFQDLLHQIRTEIMTATDLTTLNNHVIQSLLLVDDFDITCVTKFNKQYHHINQLQFQYFAEI